MKITKNQLKTMVRNVINEQYGDRYSHHKTKPTQRYSDNNKLIGEISATIADDYRFRQTLSVFYHPADDSVTVELTSTSAEGGYDYEGPGSGATPDIVEAQQKLGPGATAKDVVNHVVTIIRTQGDVIARYGKPSKNFTWGQPRGAGGQAGLSRRAAKYALDWARSR